MAEFVVTGEDTTRCDLAVSGEVDIESVQKFLDAAHECLEGPATLLRIDLAELAFIDSSGLGALVRIRNAARERDKDLELANVSASVERLFEITGLTGVFAAKSDG